VNITKKLGAQWPEDQKFVTLDPNHLYDKRNGEPHIMPTDPNTPAVPNRRRFLERVGTTLAAGTLATSSNVLAESSSNRPDIGPALNGPAAERLVEAFNLRVAQATRDALLVSPRMSATATRLCTPTKAVHTPKASRMIPSGAST